MEVEDKRINFCPDYTEEKILKAWNKLNDSTNPRVFADEVLPSMEEVPEILIFGLPTKQAVRHKPLMVNVMLKWKRDRGSPHFSGSN